MNSVYVYIYTCLYIYMCVYMYMCIYVNMCVYIYTYIYIRTHTHTHTYTYIRIYIQTDIYLRTYWYIFKHTYTWICLRVYSGLDHLANICVYAYIFLFMFNRHLYIQWHMTHNWVGADVQWVFSCMYIYKYVYSTCIHIHIHRLYTHMYICIHVYVYIYIYMYTYDHMLMHIHIFVQAEPNRCLVHTQIKICFWHKCKFTYINIWKSNKTCFQHICTWCAMLAVFLFQHSNIYVCVFTCISDSFFCTCMSPIFGLVLKYIFWIHGLISFDKAGLFSGPVHVHIKVWLFACIGRSLLNQSGLFFF